MIFSIFHLFLCKGIGDETWGGFVTFGDDVGEGSLGIPWTILVPLPKKRLEMVQRRFPKLIPGWEVVQLRDFE